MSALKKEELERLETKHGLEPDGLSYQHRCSRIAAVEAGEPWTPPEKPTAPRQDKVTTDDDITHHPLYGKRILFTPMMRPDAKRNLAFDEELGDELVVEEVNAGEEIKNKDVEKMMSDYHVIHRNKGHKVYAKTTFPKVGTEISWCIGKELVPVVRGNDGQRGYIWSYPTSCVQVGDTLIQVYGLKTLIQQVYPELLTKFSGKPIMTYIDGVTLAANIPMTEAILKEKTRKELIDERAGLNF